MSKVTKIVDSLNHYAGLVKELIGKDSARQAETMIRKTRGKVADEVLSKDASDAVRASVTPQIKRITKEYSDFVKTRADKYLNYNYEDPFVTGYLHINPKEIADIEITHRQDFFDKLTNKKFLGSTKGRDFYVRPVYDAAGNIKRHEPIVTIGQDLADRTTFRFYNKDKKLLKEVVLDENMVPIYEDVYKDVIIDGDTRVRYISYLTSLDKLTNELKPKGVKLVLRDMKE